MQLCNMNSGLKGALKHGGFGMLDPRGNTAPDFVRDLLAMLREGRIWLPDQQRPRDKTDVRLRRVIIGAGEGGAGVVVQAEAGTGKDTTDSVVK